jgi:hypothetical protein
MPAMLHLATGWVSVSVTEDFDSKEPHGLVALMDRAAKMP